MRVDQDDIDALWRTVWGEARGEPLAGKLAVAHVILNRVRLRSWMGRTVAGVCRKPRQFSCWNEDDPNRAKVLAAGPSDSGALDCLYASLGALTGHMADPTDGATHYYAFRLIHPPSWAASLHETCRIGGHAFLKRIP